jgi:hypothetical protein
MHQRESVFERLHLRLPAGIDHRVLFIAPNGIAVAGEIGEVEGRGRLAGAALRRRG